MSGPIQAGTPNATITVDGTGFVRRSVVRWNGSNRTTTFISSGELRATITAGGTDTVDIVVPVGAPDANPVHADTLQNSAATFSIDASADPAATIDLSTLVLSDGGGEISFPYSVDEFDVAREARRLRPGLPVSFPVAWDDLDDVTPRDFTVRTLEESYHVATLDHDAKLIEDRACEFVADVAKSA